MASKSISFIFLLSLYFAGSVTTILAGRQLLDTPAADLPPLPSIPVLRKHAFAPLAHARDLPKSPVNGGTPTVIAGGPPVNGGTPTVIAGGPPVNGGTPTVIAGGPPVNGGTPTVIAGVPPVNGGTPTVIDRVPVPPYRFTIPLPEPKVPIMPTLKAIPPLIDGFQFPPYPFPFPLPEPKDPIFPFPLPEPKDPIFPFPFSKAIPPVIAGVPNFPDPYAFWPTATKSASAPAKVSLPPLRPEPAKPVNSPPAFKALAPTKIDELE